MMPVNDEQRMKRTATYIAIAGVLLGLAASLFVLYEFAGGRGVLAGLLLFPFTFTYLPLYALFSHGIWDLVMLNYGSITLSWILLYAADMKDEKPRLAADEPPTQPVVTKETPSPAIIGLIIGGILFIAVICALILRAI